MMKQTIAMVIMIMDDEADDSNGEYDDGWYDDSSCDFDDGWWGWQ